MLEVKGIIAAMATPFNGDEMINEEELRNHVERLIAGGVHGLFALGTNGEFYAMDADEKKRVLEIVVDQNKGRLPVYAGTGATSTRETIRLTQMAKDLGADCASIICPYYAQGSQEMLYEHYKAVAEAVDLPILIYNMPARTGINVSYQTAAKLAKLPNIVGIKDSSGNFDNMLRYIEATRGMDKPFSVLSGNDSLILWNLLAGGQGGIAGISNLFPSTLASIYDLYQAGDLAAARVAQDSIRPIRDCMAMANPNSVVKRAANLMGYPLGPVRAPFDIHDEKIDAAIKETLKKYYQDAK